MLYFMLQWDRMMVWRSVNLLVFTYLKNYQTLQTRSVIENANGRKLDRLRKDIIAIFHNEGLKITINTTLTTTDFLDVT